VTVALDTNRCGCSSHECGGSTIVLDNGSPNTVSASSGPTDRLFPQQHVDRASSTIGPRRISVGEHGPMLPEALPHARLEDRDIPLRVQPPAVDDADAAIAVATIIDEPLHARDGFRSGHAMQVEPAAGGVFSALQLSELTPVHAWGDEASLWTVIMILPGGRRGGRGRRARCADVRSRANAPARIRREADNVRHRAREVVDVGVRGAGLASLVGVVAFLRTPLHTAIL
jgi:hypothetical protein